ncbi:hypothetical protein B0H16DRAFT_1452485 [Mycena metata]|uniref:DUF6532 domain-containing protein n=1 Tax=Mycena metata TaxID=1033252 RepID=A0AAD7JPM2_9AGAR|nr:hypothetical protein B0H16DRAFT_1452485 [Mycena metata]
MEQAEEKARQEQKAFVAAASRRLSAGTSEHFLIQDSQQNLLEVTKPNLIHRRMQCNNFIQGEAEKDLKPIAQPRVKVVSLKKTKSKVAGKGKAKQVEPMVFLTPPTGKASGVKPVVPAAKLPKLPPAKIIADLESDTKSSDEDNEGDSEMVDFEDANDEEFLIKVPQVITAKKVRVTALTSDSENKSKIDKPHYRHIKIISNSDNKLPDAPPHRTEDPGLHEAIADALVSIPQGFHGRHSSASSWSSGNELQVLDSNTDNDEEISVPVKKPHKVSAAHQKQADLEKPEIHAVPVPVKQEAQEHTLGEDPVCSEGTCHVSARITYPAPGKKDILLNSQTEELQMVLHTITQVKVSPHFEASCPPIIARAGFACSYLISAAEKHPEATHVLYCLHRDLNFATILVDIILDRINILCGDIKCVAMALTPNRLMTEKPFLYPALSVVIKQAVFNRSFKANNMHLFVSTSKAHPKWVELPDAMVALGATAVYASLVEYRATGECQNSAYEDTYKNHMKTLANTRDYAPVALHQVLHGLFKQLICFFSDEKSTQLEAGSSATLINLVEVEESD